MKTLIALLLTSVVACGQTVSPAARDGSNITNPATWKTHLSFLEASDIASGTITPYVGNLDFSAGIGGTVDNAAINTAIVTNPRATREVAELSGVPTATTANRLFYTIKKLEAARQGTTPLVLNTLTLGDSWGTDGTAGLLHKYGSFGQLSQSSWAALNGTAAISAAFGDYPLSPFGGRYVSLSTNTSSHATFGLVSAPATARLNPIRYAVVFYQGQTSGSSFTVQYEDIAGAWQTLATVATDSVATSGLQVWESSALPYSMATRIRTVWASGTPNIVAAGGTNNSGNVAAVSSTRTGITTCRADFGGSTMAQMASTSQASWNTLLGWLKPDIIFIREKSEVALASWSPNLTQLLTRLRTARPECDFVFIGRHITSDGSDSQSKEIDDYLRAYANNADNCATFVDVMRYMPETLTKSRELDINRDGEGIHTDRNGDGFIADIVYNHIAEPLTRFVESRAGNNSFSPGTMGYGFTGTVPIYFDGTLTGVGGIQFLDMCGGNTINHKARFGMTQSGYGMTGAALYNEGCSFTNNAQSWLKFDSQFRGVWSQAAFNPTRIPAGRLEMHSGSTSQVPFAITGLSGQTADLLPIYTSSTTSSNGTLATRFDAAGNLKFEVVGLGVTLKTGTNARIGTGATLASGTVTVANTSVTANTMVTLTKTASGGTAGVGYVVTKIAATSFTITAVDTAGATVTTDTSVFDWMLTERQ